MNSWINILRLMDSNGLKILMDTGRSQETNIFLYIIHYKCHVGLAVCCRPVVYCHHMYSSSWLGAGTLLVRSKLVSPAESVLIGHGD